MKNAATSENLVLDLRNSKSRKRCLSPQSNACSFLHETDIQSEDLLLENFQNKILKGKNDQEKICSECIWNGKY